MNKIDDSLKPALSRRKFLAGIGASAGAVAVLPFATGCHDATDVRATPPPPAPAPTFTDADILNFALNLEYLEAEYYLRGVTGSGLSSADTGSGAGGVTGGSAVAFKTPAKQKIAQEIANDEMAHVQFLRKALGSAAVPEPAINLSDSFNEAASLAGIGSTFNPFANEDNFLVGAFTFEDVGVTAYHGAAPLLTKKANLAAAAGIVGTESYHAGEIRELIVQLGDPYLTYAQQIAALRAKVGGGAETKLTANTIVNADSNSISYDRTPDEVLHIVYLSGAGAVSKGGFFPKGLNGKITATKS